MFSTHNNVCGYFTIAVTTPQPFSMHKTCTLLTLFWQGPGVPQTVRMVLQIRQTVCGNVEPFSVVLLVIVATNQYNTCQIHCLQKKWIKFAKFFTHYCHFPWPVDFLAICLHHFLRWSLEGALNGALNEAL